MAKTAETTRQHEAPATQPAQTQTHEHEGTGLHLHTRTLHPPVPIPYLTIEDMTSTAKAATSRVPGVPSAKDLLFYGGLGAMAVAGALEWPVALAVGGATWLVRGGRAREQRVQMPSEHDGGAGGPAGKGV